VPPRLAGDEPGRAFTLSMYADAMDARDCELDRLKALVNGDEWASIGHRQSHHRRRAAGRGRVRRRENPRRSGAFVRSG
jgi:hypothetical protein